MMVDENVSPDPGTLGVEGCQLFLNPCYVSDIMGKI